MASAGRADRAVVPAAADRVKFLADSLVYMADGELRRPTDRTCELCGRQETWDAGAESWRIVVDDGGRLAGNVYCIHEWDITGRFTPFTR